MFEEAPSGGRCFLPGTSSNPTSMTVDGWGGGGSMRSSSFNLSFLSSQVRRLRDRVRHGMSHSDSDYDELERSAVIVLPARCEEPLPPDRTQADAPVVAQLDPKWCVHLNAIGGRTAGVGIMNFALQPSFRPQRVLRPVENE